MLREAHSAVCVKNLFFDHTLTVLCIFRAGPDETVAGGNGRTAAGSFKGNQIAVVICFGKIDDICCLRDFVIGIGIVDIAQCTDDTGEQRENQQDHGEDHQPTAVLANAPMDLYGVCLFHWHVDAKIE